MQLLFLDLGCFPPTNKEKEKQEWKKTLEQVTERHGGKAKTDQRETFEQVEKHLYWRPYQTAERNGQLCITEYL